MQKNKLKELILREFGKNWKRIFIFLEFLIGGVLLGVIEDLILVSILTDMAFSLSMLGTIILVTLPFAFLGEYVIDEIDFLKLFNLNKKYKKVEIFFEFLIFGLLLGIIEDLLAFTLSTGNAINFTTILVAALVVIPFAFIGEVLIDRIDFVKIIEKKIKNNLMKKHEVSSKEIIEALRRAY